MSPNTGTGVPPAPEYSASGHEAGEAAKTRLGDVLRARSMIATSIGNTLEWFDWTIYAVFASYIAKALFNPQDSASALLSTLAVFAVGFVARPLGGLVFGNLADRLGRKSSLLVSMLLMGAASLLIGLLPSYAVIGGWASFLLLVARLVQGFAHGGESTAAYAYLAEIAPAKKRAFWSSSLFFSVGLGVMIASVFGSLLSRNLDPADMDAWGWRVPFIAGAALSVVVLYLRRHMMESDVYEADQTQRHERAGHAGAPQESWSRSRIFKRTVGIFLYQASAVLPYYIWTSFIAVFAITQRGMDPGAAFTASLGAQAINIIFVPVMGWLADRIGRKPVTVFFYLANAALIIPMLNSITSDPWSLFVAQTVMLVIGACVGGTQPAILAERVPTRYRARILGIALPLAVALFGGTAPYLISWSYGRGLGWAFNTYLVVVCLIGCVVVATWKETKGIDLSRVE
uniref:MFS transporter n=1 Tax=Castellaniella defragrans TaxID=75697 RepID=UPI00333F4725